MGIKGETSKMKLTLIVLIVAVLGAGGFWYITENSRKDREIAYQRQKELQEKEEALEKERLEMQRAEDERIRKERADAVAKEDAVRLFLNYIDREEERLKRDAEEAEIALQKIDIDQDSLEAELQAIEQANDVRLNSNTKRGEVQRDKVERVRALLKSAILNRLARTYCGSDLSALRSEFEAEMQKIKDVDDKYKKRISGNLRKYDETVKGADEKVNSKLKAARSKYASVQKEMSPQRLSNLEKQLEDLEKRINRLVENKHRSKWEDRELARLQDQQVTLQNQLLQYKDVTGLGAANALHLDATEAETEARRTFDRAGKTLTMENDLALLERDHEQDVYNRVREFEVASLGKIRSAMNMSRLIRTESLATAQKHLAYLEQKAVNIDFLKPEEIEQMRKEIAQSISKSIIEVENGK